MKFFQIHLLWQFLKYKLQIFSEYLHSRIKYYNQNKHIRVLPLKPIDFKHMNYHNDILIY